MRQKTDLFKVISEPNRVRIIMMLQKKPLCVCELTHILGLKTATVSNHLSLLRDKGFVEDEKDGKWINYKIAANPQNEQVKQILGFLPSWFKNDPQVISDLEEIKTIDRIQITCGSSSI